MSDTDTGRDVTCQRECTLRSLCRPVLDFCICVCVLQQWIAAVK